MLGANPWAQLSAHLLGWSLGAFVSAAFYKLYTAVYIISGAPFQTPTGSKVGIWVGLLPPYSFQFSIGSAVVFAMAAALKPRFHGSTWCHFIPGRVAFAISMVPAAILAFLKFV